MPEVRALQSFFDVSGKTVRNVGTEFECDERRARKLASYGMVVVIGVPENECAVQEQADEEAEEEAPKRRKKKAQ